MDVIEFLKESERMKKEDLRSFSDFANLRKPDEIVAFVEKWSAENPKKTRAKDFFEKYPNAESAVVISLFSPIEDKVPVGVCPYFLGYFKVGEVCQSKTHLTMNITDPKCVQCWLKHIEE